MNPALLLLPACLASAPAPVNDIALPPGFTARLYSGPALANDIYCMTIDDAGSVLVAGRGYVRVLVDDDGDGQADRAIDLIDGLKDGPMGLLAEGEFLYVVADGGLKRYGGYNGRDKLTKPPETILRMKTGGEHDAHTVRRGPDGWLYLLCGNGAGINAAKITSDRSPVKEPIAGSLVRISPDGKQVEVVADGFRNAYGFDFNPTGEAFTYDSDNERCVGLPWYEGCRLYHIVPGGNYGWRSPQLAQTWRKPPYFADVVAPIADLGRGSPTGVACYRHTQFPARYRSGCFLADWTFGRIYFAPLTPHGSSFAGQPELFAEAKGESGFAPTALAVHPHTGELFVSIGGRGTRGSVYRIRADEGDANPKPISMLKQTLDWNDDIVKKCDVRTLKGDPRECRHTLEMLLRFREKVPYKEPTFAFVKECLKSRDPLIRAAAARFMCAAAIPLEEITEPRALLAIALREARADSEWALAMSFRVLDDPRALEQDQLDALRVIQLACGDLTAPNAMGTVYEGYTFRNPVAMATTKRINKRLLPLMSSRNANIRREAGRTLAALGAQESNAPLEIATLRLSKRLTPSSNPIDDIHILTVLSRIAPDVSIGESVDAILWLDRKYAHYQFNRDRHWSMRVSEIAIGLSNKSLRFPVDVLQHSQFGQPGHFLYVSALHLDRAEAARKFVAASQNDPDYGWTPGLVALLSVLPDEELQPLLSRLWARGGLEDVLVPLFARDPKTANRDKFIVGLRSLDPNANRIAALALGKLPPSKDSSELVAAIKALRRLPDDKASVGTREAIAGLLRTRSGVVLGTDANAWSAWFKKAHPDWASQLDAADGFDSAMWSKRLVGIPFEAGDAGRGRKVFAKATCAACHDGGGAVGPSLQGISKRFSRDDLLTSILQPSRDVSPRYRPIRITTVDGQAFIGMVVYEATDGVILQTGPDAVVRIAGNAIETKRTLDSSLMPAGLLDKLTDEEIADLLAYLRMGDTSRPVQKKN